MVYVYLISILHVLATIASRTTMATTPMANRTTETSGIDLNAVLQRSIDLQVLAEIKEERVSQYCDYQLTRLLAARQEENAQIASALVYRLRYQLSSLSIKKQVRWAEGWVDSDLESTTGG
ncbi:hypothetical protein BGX38DRAFT_1162843 [Terfezia claveryi]|nr:hypothetical protein BGX38DRAFT_1162843 [Terfezia claveryi]